MEGFKKLGLGAGLLETLRELKFETPTPIQEKAIPLIMEGADVIGQAATGSGKTLAFGSNIIEKTQKRKGVQALVLAPTRELAEQVAGSLRKFSKEYQLNVLEVYGGVSINPQIRNLERSEIVVGTPGRILDHLERRTLNLSNVKWLVLDEADRMADMGFLPSVEEIINACPKKRQTLLFSATHSPDVDYIAKKYMNNPKYVSVESYIDPSKLRQIFYDVPSHEKFSLFVHLLKEEEGKLVMVFCNTRRNVDILTSNLARYNLDAIAIHGGLQQNKRSNVMKEFQGEKVKILICTDVAARGLHISNVSHVYNYDIPPTSTEYIHRIGRTARAGKEGKAVSLVSQRDYESLRKVLRDSSLKIEQKDLPEFEKLKPKFSAERREGSGFRDRSSRRGGGYGRERTPSKGGYDRGRSFGGGRSRDRSDRGGRDGSRSRDSGRNSRFSDRGRSFGNRGGSSRRRH